MACEAVEVSFRAAAPVLPWPCHQWPGRLHRAGQDTCRGALGYTKRCQGRSQLPRLHWVLPAIHQELRHLGSSSLQPPQEGSTVHLDSIDRDGVPSAKATAHQSTGAGPPQLAKPFAIETDACDKGIGAVLQQDGHPITYMSKALSPRYQGPSMYEKEYLAVIIAVDQWRP